ncbi:ATP-dependent RNA helicase DDX54/DBP10 [Fistulifera solaris]|uniref:RNA helicase n=1 Tax=Fistulifera solaris TaxID=1519565 RepID=A0A1Z5KLM0_FISSO|nr:ATP-dependent RNA helicase DDX54/DBP10 [Fistulifera solaris]|eukprot:GAX27214.1 ATP-dependent RNA helicase DDX54/DBP10 [Fistulifera solaris]
MAEVGKKFKQGSSGGGAGGFKALGLTEDVFRGVVRLGFKSPTPVQRKALPVILSGVDTVVMARTGSGKTVAFLIPLLEKLLAEPPSAQRPVRAIILSPTRELSQQTLSVFFKFTSVLKETDHPIRAVGIHGGESLEKQFSLLSSQPDVIIATPGRLAHHLSEIPDFTLDSCQMCILDEADRLMEMGFAMQLRQISKTFPSNCQKVLLSATLPKQLVEFTKSGFAVDPTVVRLDHEATVSADLRIAFITCRSLDKDAAFLHVLHHIKQDAEEHGESSARTGLTLVFCATRHHVDYVSTLLSASGIPATMIYGSMDQEARQSNLAAFRSGKQPVLVVTDVAARGIDVPLIDHVIHYHFPPSPKLFVHRSGRAARAGRIGFCWGLVEPDELPYMIDLHLFLGRKPTPGVVANEEDGSVSDEMKQLIYTLDDMTPEMVHYGCLPEAVMTEEVENAQRIMNSEMSGSLDVQALKNLTKVCNNAMKQYRRTRNEASREAVRRAKAILEGERMETGERVGGGAIYPHPLLRGMEIKRIQKMGKDKEKGIGALSNAKKRQEFLLAMANFRPKETVFEAFATGGGRDVGVVSHIDKGRTTHGKKHDSSAAMSAMKNMRRQMRMARDKGATLVVAGGAAVEEQNNDDDDNSVDDEKAPASSLVNTIPLLNEKPEVIHESGQRRLTKAERRRLKKNPQAVVDRTSTDEKPKEVKTDFRDPSFYMENDFTGNSEEADRSRKVESMLQPSASAVRGMAGRAVRIEEAMLDIVGDDNDALIKKQRMVRWDKSKRKYVQTTVGEELAGHSKTKKIRLESGQLARKDDSKLGELYSKWQKKTNRSVGRTGVFDDNPGPIRVKGSKDKKSSGGKSEKSELKSAVEIKKERDRQQNLKMKNMKKQDRRVVERKQKEERNAKARKEFNKSAPRRTKR